MMRKRYTDEELITLLGSADSKQINRALTELYQQHKSKSCAFIKSRGASQEEAEEVFQDALFGVWKNVQNGKYKRMASLTTYVYQLTLHLWYKVLRKRGDSAQWSDLAEMEQQHESVQEDESLDYYENCMLKIKKLGEPCASILTLFVQGFSMKEIAKKLRLGNEDNAKARKYHCVKKLEKIEL